MPTISLIVAIDLNNAIGYKNKLLFKNKEDMKWFKEHTLNKICVMGRNTYESIGKPLKNRINIVLTSRKNYNPHPDILVRHSLEEILDEFKNENEIMIIGGQTLYEQALPLADKLYITRVHYKHDKADSYFPVFYEVNWKERYFRDGKKGIVPYAFHIYERVNK